MPMGSLSGKQRIVFRGAAPNVMCGYSSGRSPVCCVTSKNARLSHSGLNHQQRRSPSTASRIITRSTMRPIDAKTAIAVVRLPNRLVERLVVDVVQAPTSDGPWLDGSRESAGHQSGHELPAVLAAHRTGELAVLPLQKASGVDHDGHEELTLPLASSRSRARAVTRLMLTLSKVRLGGYSCVTGTPPCRADAAQNDRRHRESATT